MDWSIQEIARLAGTTSRTLRHYGEIGLLPPSRIGDNGYRYYDRASLVRLQRILLLRGLGLGLPAIADVLGSDRDAAPALRNHLIWLRDERGRLARQIAAVEATIRSLEGGEQIMAEDMFDGFDHTQYKDEVEERWGTQAYATSDAWWRSTSPDEKKAFQTVVGRLNADWAAAAESGITPDGEEAQALAQRHFDWLASVPGTPGSDANGPTKAYLLGLGEMYVADPRFGANYGGAVGAAFVRDALRVYADRTL
ncbi:MerR family transcriptional regulator [Leifsonia poae]|uniref:MerR family transcriptional regulator n=1 Tax=Leifsonia poae TaxID=110933 RepID=UPI001CBF5546|nr:MerR family transcriptional regulator [Leifsonia poae]